VVDDSGDFFDSGVKDGESFTEDLRIGVVSLAGAALNIDAFSLTESCDD
jgi:hypothetical protein